MRDNRGIFPRNFTSDLHESTAWLAAETGISEKAARDWLKRELHREKGLYDPDALIELRDHIRFVNSL